jgi:hypothetical protein
MYDERARPEHTVADTVGVATLLDNENGGPRGS